MTLTLHTNLRAVLLAACTLTLAACPEGGKETESGTATETSTDAGTESASSTDATSNTPTSGTPTEGTMTGGVSDSTTQPDGSTDTASTSATEGGVTTTTEGTTAVDTDTEGDTGVVPPELQGSCMAACDKFFECNPQPPFPDKETCAAECAGSLGEGEGCLDATVAFNNCVGEFTCEELATALAEEEFGPCADEFDAMNGSCTASLCESFGGNNGADECSIGQVCEGVTEEFRCEGDACTCLVDGVAQGECDAPAGFCELEFAEQAAAAFECCGFQL